MPIIWHGAGLWRLVSGGMLVMSIAIPMVADVVNDVLGSDGSDPSICRAGSMQHAACGMRHMSDVGNCEQVYV
jgi:hypothetical protein